MMLDGYYRKRLEKDLVYWRSQGWVDEAHAAAILETTETKQSGSKLPIILGFLGAVLIVFSAMTFVAANWEEIPRFVRLLLLLSGMLISYVTAWMLSRRGYSLASDAAILVGTGVYGAAIMLVAQIYHIEAYFPDGVLLWSLGAFLAALLALSRGALVVSILGAYFWSQTEMMDFGWDVHWPFLPFWAALTALAIYMRWPPARHLTLLAILAWLVIATGQIFDLLNWPAVTALSFLMAMAALLFAGCHLGYGKSETTDYREVWLEYAATARIYALVGLLGLAFLLRVAGIEDLYSDGPTAPYVAWIVSNLALMVLAIGASLLAMRAQVLRLVDTMAIAVATLLPFMVAYGLVTNMMNSKGLGLAIVAAIFVIGLAIWAIDYGHNRQSQAAVNLGLMLFGFEVLYLYFETFGTLLDTALFFLIGGILLIALGWLLNRLRLRLTEREALP
ncbi:MAG: DUF2157 domain-containing protein [Fimbriimonadaceae bacterium]|nr:DUF2157 domain-containing protein [Alphaproteobacteria bacterium]